MPGGKTTKAILLLDDEEAKQAARDYFKSAYANTTLKKRNNIYGQKEVKFKDSIDSKRGHKTTALERMLRIKSMMHITDDRELENQIRVIAGIRALAQEHGSNKEARLQGVIYRAGQFLNTILTRYGIDVRMKSESPNLTAPAHTSKYRHNKDLRKYLPDSNPAFDNDDDPKPPERRFTG